MSVYNSEEFLAESIESILSQTLKDFEFIIINDGSSDTSSEMIGKYAGKDKRIIFVDNKKNLGLTVSLNNGLKIANGKYLARMDADDIVFPERLEKQYNYLERNKDIFLIGTGSCEIDQKGKINAINKPIADSNLVTKTLYSENCINHPSIMFRNESGNFYRDKFTYAQDYDFYLCLLTRGKRLSNIPEVLIKHRVNSKAISWNNHAKQKLFAKKAKEFYYQRMRFGVDRYDIFNPSEILNINVENSTDKLILTAEINVSFMANDFKRARKFCRKYFQYHGIFNKWIIHYVLSFCGIKIINYSLKNIFLRYFPFLFLKDYFNTNKKGGGKRD
jgi:glycosyltransferase involved in cell wall biosynthesis